MACHKENLNRKYYLDGKLVATNRHKAMEQKTDSLEEYIAQGGNTSKLTVKEHKPIYKDMKRILPGAIMQCGSERFVLQGSEGRHNGTPDYFIGTNGTKYRFNKCGLVIKNTGLVYLVKTETPYKDRVVEDLVKLVAIFNCERYEITEQLHNCEDDLSTEMRL